MREEHNFKDGVYVYFDKNEDYVDYDGDNIVCPYCGSFYDEIETEDYGRVNLEYECDKCGEWFNVNHYVETVTQTCSSKIKE